MGFDQGRNAYTDTGRNLANDPKVIELYLGTLAGSSETKSQSARTEPPGRHSKEP